MREDRDKWVYPGSHPSEGTQIVVSYNEDWLPIVSGVLFHLANKDLWSDAPDDILQQVMDLQYQLESPVSIVYPKRVTLFHEQATVLAGNPITLFVNSSQYLNAVYRQEPAANLNRFTYSFLLAAGTYKLFCHCATSNTYGKLQMSIDNAALGIEDFYSASTVFNVIKFFQFTVDFDGLHILDCVVNGKNASSSDYRISITDWYIKPDND